MGKGTNDVADTVRNQIHSRDSGLLRVAGNVRTDQAEKGDKGSSTCLREVISGVPFSGLGGAE